MPQLVKRLHSGSVFAWAFALILVLLTAPYRADASEREEITSFHSTILVLPSGSIRVTETITANCLGRKIRHGIYRDLPLIYKKGPLLSFKPDFKIIEVAVDGHSSPFHTKMEGGDIRIYIGSKTSFVSRGIHTFTLTYEMSRMVGYFDDFDEIYWNVTGNGWIFPILKASATVVLPQPSRFVRYASYTGRRGARGTMARVTQITDRLITFETTRPLMSGEGLTIAVAWPKGIVREPGPLQRLYATFKDNFGLLTGAFLFLCVLCYYLWAWSRVGKDPDLGPIVPRFDPPEGIGPCAARYIRQMGFDDKIFAVCLVNLGVKGVLRIVKHRKGFRVERTDVALPTDLVDGEDSVVRMLFGRSREVELDQSNHNLIKSVKDKLKEVLARRYEKVYFLTNLKYLVPGMVLSVLALLFLALGGGEIIPSLFITAWLTVWSFFTLFLVSAGAKGLRGFFSMPWRQKATAVRNFLFSLFFSVGIAVGGTFYYMMIGPASLFLFACILASNLLFYHLMKAPTMKGAELLSELEGFRMFLETAEAPRLEALTPPDKAPELFERYLPWAMALDVENQWAERFQQYLERTGRAAGYTPVWYHGSHYSLSGLSSDMGSGLFSAISSASISSSSGSGGGGFSGGGGGGGGGGGW